MNKLTTRMIWLISRAEGGEVQPRWSAVCSVPAVKSQTANGPSCRGKRWQSGGEETTTDGPRDKMGEEERKRRAISQMLQRSADRWVTLTAASSKRWKERFFLRTGIQIWFFPLSLLSFVFNVKHLLLYIYLLQMMGEVSILFHVLQNNKCIKKS